MEPLSTSFFDRPTVSVARDLIGGRLVRELPTGSRLVGRIVETEAYTENDPACHASHLARDSETGEVVGQGRGRDLFAAPGTAYVYLIYGVHWLLNVVTEPEGTAGAVLIRAVEPEEGVDDMRAERGVERRVNLTNGPGKLAEAFGIDSDAHKTRLTGPPLYFANGASVDDERVAQSSRIGISKAVDRAWRWYVAENQFVSPTRPSG
ncbi:MAG: DNA-3-methyladenine glycosylase [Salinibacter sp.]|uniref:DNA-3-methyladenine glycosylase n=1 Tax=Salinibacter sp. TaxID=2065818 RepID=UPI002FC294AE